MKWGKQVKPTQVKGEYEDAKLDAEAVVPSVLIQIKVVDMMTLIIVTIISIGFRRSTWALRHYQVVSV
jgi:hypothetical protein